MAGAEEIIEDYASSLEWLHTNDRYAINNFTVIAKENTEHADAISSVLVDHIAKAHPNHKLPALYVLDSIAKNIGTPYTLFLGHRLYSTFMGAYSLVDNGTRKKLDEMLKTWKQPVPGSLDSRPVFDSAITKRIENALIQAKTRTLQVEQRQQKEQQDLLRRRAPGAVLPNQWRNTPTPPQNASAFPVPSSQGFVRYEETNSPAPHTTHLPFHANQMPIQAAAVGSYSDFTNIQGGRQTQQSLFTNFGLLERDVQDLINKFQDLVTRNYNDAGAQTKLKALKDLQTLLKSQDLPPDQLQAVRTQVDALQTQLPQLQSGHTPLAPTPVSNYASHSQSSYQNNLPHYTQPQTQSQTIASPHLQFVGSSAPNQPLSQISSIPSSDFLAKLLEGRTSTPQASITQTLSSEEFISSSAPQAPVLGTENPLIAQLRDAGLLTSAGTPEASITTQGKSMPSAPVNTMASLKALFRHPLAEKSNEIELTSASLKIPRLQLIEKLYGELPNQCLTCGKRFLNTEEGKGKKARHMDWHFRTNQRLTDAAQRGQSRSWYVDEIEWIKYREDGYASEGAAGQVLDEAASGNVSVVKNDPRKMFIRVPSENDLPCGICQEKFVPFWNEQLQDFVWMDAIRVGDKIYHASCYHDFKKDESNTPARTATPDSVLGKRKAEPGGETTSPAKRIVVET